MTTTVAATDFCRNFGQYQRRVQREPIEVRSHERTTGYFISEEEFKRYMRLSNAARQAYHPSELPEHLKRAIAEARMDPRHEHLNELLDEK